MTLFIGEEDAPSFGVAAKPRRKRNLTPVQVFSKNYYHSLVKPTVDAKLLGLAGEGTLSRAQRMTLRNTETDLAWANASEEVKAEVQKIYQNQRNTNVEDTDDDGDGDDGDNNNNGEDTNNSEDKKPACQEPPKDQHLTGKALEK